MADEERIEPTEEELAEIAEQWEKYVREEVNTMLDIFLPDALAGNVGIKYAHPIIETYEDGSDPKIDKGAAIGVNININFRFKHTVKLPEPKEEE